MAIIKKFRITNFKKKKELLKLDKISLYFGKRKILENLNLYIVPYKPTVLPITPITTEQHLLTPVVMRLMVT